MTWTSSPTTTWSSGAPYSPCSETFHPARASSACRAAARPVKFAICPPVTKPTAASAGSPKSPFSHRPAISSSTATVGEAT